MSSRMLKELKNLTPFAWDKRGKEVGAAFLKDFERIDDMFSNPASFKTRGQADLKEAGTPAAGSKRSGASDASKPDQTPATVQGGRKSVGSTGAKGGLKRSRPEEGDGPASEGPHSTVHTAKAARYHSSSGGADGALASILKGPPSTGGAHRAAGLDSSARQARDLTVMPPPTFTPFHPKSLRLSASGVEGTPGPAAAAPGAATPLNAVARLIEAAGHTPSHQRSAGRPAASHTPGSAGPKPHAALAPGSASKLAGITSPPPAARIPMSPFLPLSNTPLVHTHVTAAGEAPLLPPLAATPKASTRCTPPTTTGPGGLTSSQAGTPTPAPFAPEGAPSLAAALTLMDLVTMAPGSASHKERPPSRTHSREHSGSLPTCQGVGGSGDGADEVLTKATTLAAMSAGIAAVVARATPTPLRTALHTAMRTRQDGTVCHMPRMQPLDTVLNGPASATPASYVQGCAAPPAAVEPIATCATAMEVDEGGSISKPAADTTAATQALVQGVAVQGEGTAAGGQAPRGLGASPPLKPMSKGPRAPRAPRPPSSLSKEHLALLSGKERAVADAKGVAPAGDASAQRSSQQQQQQLPFPMLRRAHSSGGGKVPQAQQMESGASVAAMTMCQEQVQDLQVQQQQPASAAQTAMRYKLQRHQLAALATAACTPAPPPAPPAQPAQQPQVQQAPVRMPPTSAVGVAAGGLAGALSFGGAGQHPGVPSITAADLIQTLGEGGAAAAAKGALNEVVCAVAAYCQALGIPASQENLQQALLVVNLLRAAGDQTRADVVAQLHTVAAQRSSSAATATPKPEGSILPITPLTLMVKTSVDADWCDALSPATTAVLEDLHAAHRALRLAQQHTTVVLRDSGVSCGSSVGDAGALSRAGVRPGTPPQEVLHEAHAHALLAAQAQNAQVQVQNAQEAQQQQHAQMVSTLNAVVSQLQHQQVAAPQQRMAHGQGLEGLTPAQLHHVILHHMHQQAQQQAAQRQQAAHGPRPVPHLPHHAAQHHPRPHVRQAHPTHLQHAHSAPAAQQAQHVHAVAAQRRPRTSSGSAGNAGGSGFPGFTAHVAPTVGDTPKALGKSLGVRSHSSTTTLDLGGPRMAHRPAAGAAVGPGAGSLMCEEVLAPAPSLAAMLPAAE